MLDVPTAKGVAVRTLRGGWLRAAGGVLVLLAALTGCGDERSEPGGTTPAPTETTSSPSGGGSESPSPTNGGNGSGGNGSGGNGSGGNGSGGNGSGEEDRDEIAWVPFGPSGPDTPPPFGWYAQLESGDCGGLAGRLKDEKDARNDVNPALGPLYIALAEGCQATQGDQPELWSDAREDLRSAVDDLAGDELGCYDQAALDLAERMLEADPDRPPEVRSSTGTACEWEITRVDDATEPADSDTDPRGGLEGGAEVVIRGAYLAAIDEVWFGEVQAESFSESDDKTTLFVTSPAAESPGSVRITLRSREHEIVSPEDQTFTYEGDETPEPDGDETTGAP